MPTAAPPRPQLPFPGSCGLWLAIPRGGRPCRRRMQELLLSIWESERKTVLFVTHDIEEAIFMANRVVVMTARPGRIKAELAVALSHPRHYTVKTSPEFSVLKAELTEQIRVEALKAVEPAGI